MKTTYNRHFFMIIPIKYGYRTSSYEFALQYCYESHQVVRTVKINF